MFSLDLEEAKATHFRTIRHPLLHGPNSVTLINSNELLVTNDHHFPIAYSRVLATAETYLSLPIGTVVHVDVSELVKDPTAAVEASVVARVPFANGIEFLNSTTLAVASTSKTSVYLYNFSQPTTDAKAPPTLTYLTQIKFPFWVDNISVSKDGTLYVAGHPFPPLLNSYGKSRYDCRTPTEEAAADLEKQELCDAAPGPSWVSRWTEAGGVEHLYAETEFPTSSTAAFDSERKIGIMTGLYAKGIIVWKE